MSKRCGKWLFPTYVLLKNIPSVRKEASFLPAYTNTPSLKQRQRHNRQYEINRSTSSGTVISIAGNGYRGNKILKKDFEK